MLGRVAELFGLDPNVVCDEWTPARQNFWMKYAKVRIQEEARDLAARGPLI